METPPLPWAVWTALSMKKLVFVCNLNLPKAEAFSPCFPLWDHSCGCPLSKAPPCPCLCPVAAVTMGSVQLGGSWGMQALQADPACPLWETLLSGFCLSVPSWSITRGVQHILCVPTASLGTDGRVSPRPGVTQGSHLSLTASSSARLLRSSGILPASQLAWQKVSLGCLEGYRSVSPAWL